MRIAYRFGTVRCVHYQSRIRCMHCYAETNQDSDTCDVAEEDGQHQPFSPHNRDPCINQECGGVGIQRPTPSVQRGFYREGDHVARKLNCRRPKV